MAANTWFEQLRFGVAKVLDAAGVELPWRGRLRFAAPFVVSDDTDYQASLVEVDAPALLRCGVEELSLGIDVVRDYGADPTGVADSTAAIQAAIDAAAAAGGGIVYFPPGTYTVHLDPAGYSEDPSDRRVTALVVRDSGVRIVGAGIGITTIRCASTDGSYGVIEFAQLPIENGVVKLVDCAVRDITLDGNRDSAAEPVNRASVLSFKGTARLDVEHVQVMRSAYYGIGFQNGGFQQCRIHHVLIENVGADGIDIKDSGSISEAFDISDLWIKNFGRLTDPYSFAGLDVASLAPRIRGVHITGFGAEGSPGAGLRLKQGTDLAARGWGPQWAVVSDVIVEQTSPTVAGVQGVRINSGLISLSNVHVNGVTGNGIRAEQSYVRASNVLIKGESSATGIYLRARSLAADEQPFDGADDCVFNGVTILGCSRGIHNSRIRNRFTAVKIHDCATGVYGDSTIEAMAIDGIDFSGAVTTPWLMGGTRHQITGVSGAIGPYDGIITTSSEPRTRTHHSYSGFRWYTGFTGDPAGSDEFLRLAPGAGAVAWQLQGGNRDFILTPSGTGLVRFGTVAEAGNGSGESLVLGIKDAGGTARNVAIADARNGVYNVLAYGADPTGAADSTASLKAAFEAAIAAGGGTVTVPDGDYLIAASGPDAGGCYVTLTASLRVECSPNARFFTDDLDHDMIRFSVPNNGVGLPTDLISFEWIGGVFDQREQRVSTVVPHLATYPAPAGKDGSSATTDGLAVYGSWLNGATQETCLSRAVVRDVVFVAGDHWQSAGGDSGLFIGEGSEWTEVSGCVFVGHRDQGCYASGLGGRALSVHDNSFVNCFYGSAAKRGFHNFRFYANHYRNCVCGAQTNVVTAAGNGGAIFGNTFDGCSVFVRIAESVGVSVFGNAHNSLGAYLEDGVTAVAVLGSTGYLLQGAKYCTVRDAHCGIANTGHTATLVFLGGVTTGGATTTSEFCTIENCNSVDFSRCVEEDATGANSNRISRCYNYGTAGVRDPISAGALTSVERWDPAAGKMNFRTGFLAADGTAAAPIMGRATQASTGVFFAANKIGFSTGGTERGAFLATGFVTRLAASVAPAANGQMMFELTTDTTLTIRVRGSDGVTRSAELTLA